jgi:hypothetical protein
MTMDWLKGKGWLPWREEFESSPAFRLISPLAKEVFHCLQRAYLRNAGKDNGRLVVPYNRLRIECKGASKRRIADALDELKAVRIIVIEKVWYGGKQVNRYLLTHLPEHPSGHPPPRDLWAEFRTDEEVVQILNKLKPKKEKPHGRNSQGEFLDNLHERKEMAIQFRRGNRFTKTRASSDGGTGPVPTGEPQPVPTGEPVWYPDAEK